MGVKGGTELNRNEEVIVSLMGTIESERKDRDEFKRAWLDHLLDRVNQEPEGGQRDKMAKDVELFNKLFGDFFEKEEPLTDSVGATPEQKWAKQLHKETNAVAVYVVEGVGYDQFGDEVKVQLTRREIHDMDIRTATGAALLEGVVQLNRKAITDALAKSQHVKASQAYAYTQLVPVLKRKPSDA